MFNPNYGVAARAAREANRTPEQRWSKHSPAAFWDRVTNALGIAILAIPGGIVASCLKLDLTLAGSLRNINKLEIAGYAGSIALVVAAMAFQFFTTDWTRYENKEVATQYCHKLRQKPELVYSNRDKLFEYGFMSKENYKRL